MPQLNSSTIHIKQPVKQQKLSAAQKKFNGLIKKIAAKKKRLQDWQALIPDFQGKLSQDYEPLQEKYSELRTELVLRLDKFFLRKSFTPTQKAKISHIISELCDALIDQHDTKNLKSIYEKHGEIDFEVKKEEQGNLLKNIFEDSFGLDLGDDFDATNPEEMAKRIAQKMAERGEQAEENPKRKQTAKEQRLEVKQKTEQKNISQSIKSVYRQLITAYHPDRETDPEERDRKTEIMQRVNNAYKNNDLIKLLALQLELEQIDQDHINTIAEDRLKTFNKILQNQLDQLLLEIGQVEMPFRMSANIPSYAFIDPKKFMCIFNNDIKELQQDIKNGSSGKCVHVR